MKKHITSIFAGVAAAMAMLFAPLAPAFAESVDVSADATVKARIGDIINKRKAEDMRQPKEDRERTEIKEQRAGDKDSKGRGISFEIRQGRILAAARRAVILADMFSAMAPKLQARIDAAKAAGKDTTAMAAAHADMTVKIAEAKAQAQIAITAVANLKAPGADAAVMQANNEAFKKAREALIVAERALKAAGKDIRMIIGSLVDLKVDATAGADGTVR